MGTSIDGDELRDQQRQPRIGDAERTQHRVHACDVTMVVGAPDGDG